MIITVGGQAASGKSTLAKALAERLRYRHISAGHVMREMAAERGTSLVEFSRYAEKHPEVDPGNHARPTHHRLVKPLAQMLQAFVDLVPLQDLVDLGVERVTRCLRDLLRAEKQWFLLRFALAHRHTIYDVWNIS